MACVGLVRVGRRIQFQTLGSGVIRRSPVILHECVTKRYIEFNFSPEKTLEDGGKAVNESGVLVYPLRS
jgi:hypothetical protein